MARADQAVWTEETVWGMVLVMTAWAPESSSLSDKPTICRDREARSLVRKLGTSRRSSITTSPWDARGAVVMVASVEKRASSVRTAELREPPDCESS